jgi:hypothetical protein
MKQAGTIVTAVPGVMSCEWNFVMASRYWGKSVDPLERNYHTTTETLKSQLQLRWGAKNKAREINYTARGCLVEDHHFIWQISVGNSGRFVCRIKVATNMSIGVGAVTKDVV